MSQSLFAEAPDEIVLKISENFGNTERQALAALSLCCKKFHRIIQPLLYTTFVQTGPTALPFFLRTISSDKNEHLRVYTKKIIVASLPRTKKSKLPRMDMRSLTRENRTNMRSVIREAIDGPDAEEIGWDWEDEAFKKGYWEALYPLALAMLPKIESIELTTPGWSLLNDNTFPPGRNHTFAFDQHFIQRICMRQARDINSPYSLSKLHTISIRAPNHGDHNNDFEILPYLTSPGFQSVTKLSIHRSLLSLQPSKYTFTSNVTSLSLTECLGLCGFLKGFPLLERFEYAQSRVHEDGTFPLVAPHILGALSHLKNTLQELKILVPLKEYNVDLSRYPFVWNSFESLSAFKNLKILEVTDHFLVGFITFNREVEAISFSEERKQKFVARLPSSLEKLTMRNCHILVLLAVGEMFKDDDVLLNLKTVDLEVYGHLHWNGKTRDYYFDYDDAKFRWAGVVQEAFNKGVVLSRHGRSTENIGLVWR